MAGSINKVTLVGRVGKDPTTRTTQSGDKIVSFSIATSESWKDKNTGERKEKSDWHNVVIFNSQICEIAEKYVRKGALIGVEGKLETRKWTDNGGVERYSTEVVLPRFRGELTLLLRADGNSGGGGRSDGDHERGGSGGGAGAPRGAQTRPGPDLDDDIPFAPPWA